MTGRETLPTPRKARLWIIERVNQLHPGCLAHHGTQGRGGGTSQSHPHLCDPEVCRALFFPTKVGVCHFCSLARRSTTGLVSSNDPEHDSHVPSRLPWSMLPGNRAPRAVAWPGSPVRRWALSVLRRRLHPPHLFPPRLSPHPALVTKAL